MPKTLNKLIELFEIIIDSPFYKSNEVSQLSQLSVVAQREITEKGKSDKTLSPKKRLFRFTGISEKGKHSDKFWEVWVEGDDLFVRFGKYGTEGRSLAKEFPSHKQALEEMQRRIKKKTRKGYQEIGIEEKEKIVEKKVEKQVEPKPKQKEKLEKLKEASKKIIERNEKEEEQFKKETGAKKTIYRGKPTKAYKEWREKQLKKVKKEKPKIKTKPTEEKKKVPKEIKSKEWDLSIKIFKSKAEQRSVIEDINFIFENIIFFFSQREKFEYGYLEEEQKYQIKYIPDEVNDFLVSELDKLIERRIKEKISLATLTSNLSSLMDKTEKIEPKKVKEKPKEEKKKVSKKIPKKHTENYITDTEVENILKIYNSLSNEEKSIFLDYLRTSIENVESNIKELHDFTLGLKVDIINAKVDEIKDINTWWNGTTRRWNFLRTIAKYKAVPRALYQSNWEEISPTSQKRIIKNLKIFKTLLLKYRSEIIPEEEVEVKVEKIVSMKRLDKEEDILKFDLRENILANLCAKKGSYVPHNTIVKDFYELGYSPLDLEYGGYDSKQRLGIKSNSFFKLALIDLIDNLFHIKSSSTYAKKGYDKYSYAPSSTICQSKHNQTLYHPSYVPQLEPFPNIKGNDIGKRAILQIMCYNCRSQNKTAGMVDYNIRNRWIKFFKTYYKTLSKKNYLIETLKLTDDLSQKSHFDDKVDELEREGILYKGTFRGKPTIRWNKEYEFLWKIYQLGVFYQQPLEIDDNSIYIDEINLDKKINTLNMKLKHNQNLKKHLKEILRHLKQDKKTPRFYLLGIFKLSEISPTTPQPHYPIYIIFDYDGFAIYDFMEYNDKTKKMSRYDLGMKMLLSKINAERIQLNVDKSAKLWNFETNKYYLPREFKILQN